MRCGAGSDASRFLRQWPSARAGLGVLAAVAVGAAVSVSAAPASAATVDIGPGSVIRIENVPFGSAALGRKVECTLAFTGKNGGGEPIGFTAGHCGKAGDRVTTPAGVDVGVIEKSVEPAGIPFTPITLGNTPDWRRSSSAPRCIRSRCGQYQPPHGGYRCGWGQGLLAGPNVGYACGEVTAVSGPYITTSIARRRETVVDR